MKAIKQISQIAVALTCLLAPTLKAQNIYVANLNTIGEYGPDGSTINASLISGLVNPESMAISGTNLFVAYWVTNGQNAVGEYSTSGAVINTNLIPGLDYPTAIAISGTNLFIANGDTIGEYSTSGATVNSNLISGLGWLEGIAISGTNLFVLSNSTVSEYTTSGAMVNASLISATALSGLVIPAGIAISGDNLFVLDDEGNVAEYTIYGQTVNASLISGINYFQAALAIFGTRLFLTREYPGAVSEFTTSGATVNASLISGLQNPSCIAVSPPPPQLNIASVGNQSVLYYPIWAENYVVQCAPNPASTNWLTVTNGVPVIAVAITNNLPETVFRLVPPQ